MTFRAAVEKLGSVQPHTTCCRKTKKLMGALQDCNKSIFVYCECSLIMTVMTSRIVRDSTVQECWTKYRLKTDEQVLKIWNHLCFNCDSFYLNNKRV